MNIKAVIIDDEPLARSRIARLLKEIEGVTLVAECWNARNAIDVINQKTPDLIFLDIEMPEKDGFTVIEEIHGDRAPLVVVVSAYDQYAMRAFDVQAVDYLHKPFDKERFDQAISRVKNHIDLRNASLFQQQIKELVIEQEVKKDQQFIRSLSIKESGRLKFIAVDDVYFFESHGNYVKLHLDQSSKIYRSTMHKLEMVLNPDIFIRIHRSFILNIRKIKKIQYLNNNEYRFTLVNKQQVVSSRSYKDEIAKILTMF